MFSVKIYVGTIIFLCTNVILSIHIEIKRFVRPSETFQMWSVSNFCLLMHLLFLFEITLCVHVFVLGQEMHMFFQVFSRITAKHKRIHACCQSDSGTKCSLVFCKRLCGLTMSKVTVLYTQFLWIDMSHGGDVYKKAWNAKALLYLSECPCVFMLWKSCQWICKDRAG